MSLRVEQPGVLSLLQDPGRRGQHALGLTEGGPLDPYAFTLCQRLLHNLPSSAAIELSVGGLSLLAEVDCTICLTGAPMPLAVDGQPQPMWQALRVRAGGRIAIGHARRGLRAYLGVAGGIAAPQVFGSCATVVREGLGGLDGRGRPLAAGDRLPLTPTAPPALLRLPEAHQPDYPDTLTLRVVPGYQQALFSRLDQRRFFASAYTVTAAADRMGYRLAGPAVRAGTQTLLSEGICLGAIQLPADGQPIVLLNDRQTIGGYPKLGAVLSLDCARLAQLGPGAEVRFTPVSPHTAHNALHLAAAQHARLPLEAVGT